MEKNFEYLPMGSVVLLKNGIKKVMIFGRKQLNVDDLKEYDYCAYLYPEGNIKKDLIILFNHSYIKEIVWRGYEDEDEIRFRTNFLQTGKVAGIEDVFEQEK